MMADRDAREVLAAAFAARGLEPNAAELQGVQAIGRFEGNYGAAFGGANNWGAVQCKMRPPCDPSRCVEHGDSHADGTKYRACFRKYPTPVDGAADLVRELYRRAGVPEALRLGDALAVAAAMRAAGYFEAPATTYALAIEKNAQSIAQSLGEPWVMRRGGGGIEQPPTTKPTPAGGGGGVLLFFAALLGARALAGRFRRRA